jgi:hypothetical protein
MTPSNDDAIAAGLVDIARRAVEPARTLLPIPHRFDLVATGHWPIPLSSGQGAASTIERWRAGLD